MLLLSSRVRKFVWHDCPPSVRKKTTYCCRTEVKAAYIRFHEAFTICDTQEKSLELAAQNYSVVNNRYLNDLALITDMLDASNSKLNAELQLVNAQINILFNLYKLKKTAGCL